MGAAATKKISGRPFAFVPHSHPDIHMQTIKQSILKYTKCTKTFYACHTSKA